jgi:hypothetical protein
MSLANFSVSPSWASFVSNFSSISAHLTTQHTTKPTSPSGQPLKSTSASSAHPCPLFAWSSCVCSPLLEAHPTIRASTTTMENITDGNHISWVEVVLVWSYLLIRVILYIHLSMEGLSCRGPSTCSIVRMMSRVLLMGRVSLTRRKLRLRWGLKVRAIDLCRTIVDWYLYSKTNEYILTNCKISFSLNSWRA